jgi:hypothetical protein
MNAPTAATRDWTEADLRPLILDGRPQSRAIAENQIYTTPLLPGFELPVARLMQLADQYRDEE